LTLTVNSTVNSTGNTSVNPITGNLQLETPKRSVGTNAKAGATHSSLERSIPLPNVVISAQ
jgi:hypothetical protein